MSKVKIIAHPETKALFTATSKEGWVKCQLASEEMTVNNGVVALNRRVAFPVLQAKLLSQAPFAGLKDGDDFPINGKIIRRLTSVPQYEGHQEVINPSTGEAMGYYQSFTFTADLSASDIDERVLVQADSAIGEILG